MKTSYGEIILEADTIERAFELLRLKAFQSLVVRIGDSYIPLDSLPYYALRGKPRAKTSFVNSTPGFSVALNRVAEGYYLISRKNNTAYTPRSLVLYLLSEGRLSLHTLVDKLRLYRLPCLKCNSTIRRAYRVFLETRAIALPVCHRGHVENVITAADLAYHAFLKRGEASLDDNLPVAKVAGSFLTLKDLRRLSPKESLKQYSVLLLEDEEKIMLSDASSLRRILEHYKGVSRVG
ncbi:MAG: hypothetical protein ABWK01_05765 [Infirmifilum sp.]